MTETRPPHETIAEMESAYQTVEELETAHATADLDAPAGGIRWADVDLTFDQADVPPDRLTRRAW